MKINKTIKNLRGEEMPKSYPTKEEFEALPKNDKGGRDVEQLPRETIGNVILNCLEQYPVKKNKEGFYINIIASSIINAEDDAEIELKDKFKTFLIEVIQDSTFKQKEEDGKKKAEGMYSAWVTSQVLAELGVKEEE
jgi:hypothetical protein